MGKRGQSQSRTTRERAEKHDALVPLLKAMHREFQDLSRKKPDGTVSKGKIGIVNRLLKDLLTMLEGEPQRQFLDILEEDDIPQNSDVVLVLSQYCAAMDQFHAKYYGEDEDYVERWFTSK